MDIQVITSGSNEIIKAFQDVASIIDDDKLLDEFLKSAVELRNAIRRNAPKGPPKKSEWARLRNAVVARKYKRQIWHNPAVFVAIDRKKAPHAHWVEYGARMTPSQVVAGIKRKHPTDKKALAFINKAWMLTFAKSTWPGPMPATHFFSRSVDQNRTKTQDGMEKAAWGLIQAKWG